MIGSELCTRRRTDEFVVDVAKGLIGGAARVECFAGIEGGEGEGRRERCSEKRKRESGASKVTGHT